VPCQQHWLHAIRGLVGVHTSFVSDLMHPAHASISTINPSKQKKSCSGGSVQEVAALSSRAVGGNGALMGHGQAHLSRCCSHTKTCTLCFHTSRSSVPHPEFCCYISMVCAAMACYMLESSESVSSGQIFNRAVCYEVAHSHRMFLCPFLENPSALAIKCT
jgi:hypothetical protein